MNQLGLGFVFTAKDKATSAFKAMQGALSGLRSDAKKTQQEIAKVGTGGVAGATRGADGRLRGAGGKFVSEGGKRGKGGGIGAGDGFAFGAGAAGAFAMAKGAAATAMQFADATSEGARFASGLAKLGVRANASAEELAQFRAAAINAGLSTKFKPDEAVGALSALSSAGLNAQESLKLLNTTLAFTAAADGRLTTDQSAMLLAQSMAQFNISAGDAHLAADKMAKTADSFAANIEDLPLGLANAARGVNALGTGIDDTLISFGLMRKLMPRVESAGTAVGVAMESMAKSDVQKALKGIGVDAVTAEGKFRPFLDVVTDMIPELSKMTDAKRADFLQSTFGADAVQGLGAVFRQLTDGIKDNTGKTLKGKDAIKFLRKEMAGAEGGLKKLTDATSAGFGGAMDKAIAKLGTFKQVFGEALGDAIAPAIESMGDGLTKMVLGFEKLDATSKKNVVALTVIGVVVAGLAAAFGSTGLIVGAVIGAVIGFVYAFRQAIDKNIGGIASSVAKLSLVWDGLKQAFTQGGFSGAVRDELNKAENAGLKSFIINVFTLAARLQHFGASIKSGFGAALERMGPTFDRLSTSVRSFAIRLGMMDSSTEGTKAAWASFGAAGAKVGAVLGVVFDLVLSAIAGVLEAGEGFMTMGKTLKSSWGGVGEALSSVGATIGDVARKIGLLSPGGNTSAWRTFGRVMGAVVSMVGGIVSVLAQTFAGLFTVVGGVVKMIAGLFKGDWALVWEGAKDVVMGLVKAVGELLIGMAMQIAMVIDGIGSMAGTDIGATKKVEGLRDAMRKELAPKAPDPETTAMASEMTAGLVAGAQYAQPSAAAAEPVAGPAVDTKQIGADVAAALAKMPPPIVNFNVDGETVATAIAGGDRATNPAVSR